MKKLELLSSTFISVFTYLFGGLDSLIRTLLIIIVLDYITGIIKALIKKKLNSTIGIKGIIKKLGYLLVVILVTNIDNILGDNTQALRTLVLYFFIANESISILENWALIGLPLPQKLYNSLEKLKNDDQ